MKIIVLSEIDGTRLAELKNESYVPDKGDVIVIHPPYIRCEVIRKVYHISREGKEDICELLLYVKPRKEYDYRRLLKWFNKK